MLKVVRWLYINGITWDTCIPDKRHITGVYRLVECHPQQQQQQQQLHLHSYLVYVVLSLDLSLTSPGCSLLNWTTLGYTRLLLTIVDYTRLIYTTIDYRSYPRLLYSILPLTTLHYSRLLKIQTTARIPGNLTNPGFCEER